MNLFIGILPDESANHKIRKVVGEIGRIFDGQQVPVRWVKPETFHVTVFHVGKDISLVKRLLLKNKVKKISFQTFEISFKSVRLGISRKYKELVFLVVDNGDENMRKITEQIDMDGKIRGANTFVPHLTLGRVSKELSDEEYRNLSRDLENVSKDLNIEEISFAVKEVYLIKSDQGNYDILMNCSAC